MGPGTRRILRTPVPQAGTYTISVTGNFTSGSTALTHAAKLTLIVQ
jgi:hypothetical protein